MKDLKRLNVFHGLVNYGTQSGYIAKGLRLNGVNARSYTKVDAFKRETDYAFEQKKSLIAKFFYY